MMKEEEQSQPLPQATRERILGIAMVAETLVVLVASFLFVSQEQGVHDVFSLISQNYFLDHSGHRNYLSISFV